MVADDDRLLDVLADPDRGDTGAGQPSGNAEFSFHAWKQIGGSRDPDYDSCGG